MNFIEWLKQPWPWYVAGPLIGLMVPTLLILGNKTFGISSSLRHICAACVPANIAFFKYDWKKEVWNLFFAGGIVVGALVAVTLLQTSGATELNPDLMISLQAKGINDFRGLLPGDLFSWPNLFTLKGLILMVGGGFLVGFGTRYAGGCTSGHSIMGLSNLQLPSLIATLSFMAGGFVVANLILPLVLSL